MPARVALALLALVTGGFPLVDGIHVQVRGRYLGPETPGPWRHVVAAVGIDPFAMGPAFTGGSALLRLLRRPAGYGC